MIQRCMCLSKRLLSKIVYHVLYMIFNVYINMLNVGHRRHVVQFTMPYPFGITQNDPLSDEMWPYIVHYVSSPIPTCNTWTKIFSTHNLFISFRKFQALLNPILILDTVLDAFIQFRSIFPLLSYSQGCPICMKILFFS